MARPKCTGGRITLATKDPLMPPVIRLEYVCDPEGVGMFNIPQNEVY